MPPLRGHEWDTVPWVPTCGRCGSPMEAIEATGDEMRPINARKFRGTFVQCPFCGEAEVVGAGTQWVTR